MPPTKFFIKEILRTLEKSINKRRTESYLHILSTYFVQLISLISSTQLYFRQPHYKKFVLNNN